jgi:putative redox protein
MITTTWQAGETPAHSSNGSATWAADLTPQMGGSGTLPDPHDLLDSALASCTALTLQIYVRRKSIPLTGVVVEVERTETRESYFLQRTIRLQGELDQAQIADLLRVANICPIHKVLSGKIAIETTVVP